MKTPTLFFAIALTALSSWCTRMTAQQANFQVVPRPVEVTAQSGDAFTLNASTVICYEKGSAAAKRNAEFLQAFIAQRTGLSLKQSTKKARSGAIVLTEVLKSDNPEAYRIEVGGGLIRIDGASPAGTFYGIQTLRKAMPAGKAAEVSVPATVVNDYPRFSYRGAHLDVARHFFPADSVKQFIDMIALHNINRLHWHLTDDQGWRIEIKKYPGLTTIASTRPETVIGHNSGKYDGTPHGGFYTQQEARDIVSYAAERGITVIPEIDLPGHMQAALAAYPDLGCTGGPYEVWKIWGVSDNVLCAGNDRTFEFIDNVLKEITEIFPSEYIHVGGDECPKTQWGKCPKCQARIKANHLEADGKHSAEERLQSYVINHAEKYLNSLGRQIIGWDETLEGGLAPNATVMSWRGEGGGLEAARQKHNVIMTPNTYLYFDYYQSKDIANEPEAIGGYLPLERVYSYEPVPDKFSAEEASYITGVQANIWTEYIPTYKQLEYMELPRMAALAEIQWTPRGTKDYADFCHRAVRLIDVYKELGYNYAKHIFDVKAAYATDTTRRCITATLTTMDNAEVRYTLNGTEPTANSTLYNAPIAIQSDCQLRAAAFRNGERSHIEKEDFSFSKSTACPINMLQPVNKQYEFAGGITLVDGLKATDTNYQTGRWIAFYPGDLECVIDLGESTELAWVAIQTCVEKGAWVFDARSFAVETSDDGVNFTPAAAEEYPAMQEDDANGIYKHKLELGGIIARYLKVKAASEHSIPEWHGGKGNHGFLFIDEIEVR